MMRKTMLAAVAALGTLGMASTAEAGDRGWGFQFGFGRNGTHVQVGYSNGRYRSDRRVHHRRVHHRRVRHTHVRTPVYSRVWVEPVFRTVVAGYDSCGRPVYQRVMVRAGYWASHVTGYHCGTCRAVLH